MNVEKVFAGKDGKPLMLVHIEPTELHHFEQCIQTESGDAYTVISPSVINGACVNDHRISIDGLKELLGDAFETAKVITRHASPVVGDSPGSLCANTADDFYYRPPKGSLIDTTAAHPNSVFFEGVSLKDDKKIMPVANHFLTTGNRNLHVIHGKRQSGVTTKIGKLAKAFAHVSNQQIAVFCHEMSPLNEVGDLVIRDAFLNAAPSVAISTVEKDLNQCVVVIDDYRRYLSDDQLVDIANEHPNITFVAGMSFD